MTSFQSTQAARQKAQAAARQPTEPPSPEKAKEGQKPGGVEMPGLKPLHVQTDLKQHKEEHHGKATFFNEDALGGAATSLAPEALDMVKEEIYIQIDAMQSEI